MRPNAPREGVNRASECTNVCRLQKTRGCGSHEQGKSCEKNVRHKPGQQTKANINKQNASPAAAHVAHCARRRYPAPNQAEKTKVKGFGGPETALTAHQRFPAIPSELELGSAKQTRRSLVKRVFPRIGSELDLLPPISLTGVTQVSSTVTTSIFLSPSQPGIDSVMTTSYPVYSALDLSRGHLLL